MSESARRLILITGTGRSGTSTMSGIFHHLGLEVPGPHLGANESNPKGFYESRWAVRFHNDLCQRAQMHIMDSRPTAFDSLQAVVTQQDRQRLVKWIGRVAEGHDQIVVKDPRSVWTQHLWCSAAAEHGLTTTYVSMLRHPAETIGSRATYYASDDLERRRRYEVFNISRWINNQLVSERETRSQPRGFVRYTDLLTDWRPVVKQLVDDLDLSVAPSGFDVPSPVDDFISPDLRRVRITWDDLSVPEPLTEIAEGVWTAVNDLADGKGGEETHLRLDSLATAYQQLFQTSAAIAHDAAEDRIQRAREEGRRLGHEEAQADAEGGATTGALGPGALSDDARISDVRSRDLLKEVGRRVVGRVRPTRKDQGK